MADRVTKDLAQAIYDLARAVELLAREQGNTQAGNWARKAKSEGNHYR